MKKRLFFFAAMLAAATVVAQAPVNDDCTGIIDLGDAPACPPDTFSNVDATPTDIGFDNDPSCFDNNTATHDVWFQFTCPATIFDFRVTVSGVGADGLVNPEFAIYRGDCEFDGLAELICVSSNDGDTTVYLDVFGLTPGLPYYIRITDYSLNANPNWGDFVLCVDEVPPAVTIDQGSSSLCEGTIFDSGGEDGDYGADEDHTFVICPNSNPACITFTLDYYNIENGDFLDPGDILAFYDGDDTNAPLIGELNGSGFGANTYAAGGGVCFQVQATSGCLTLQFQSDATVEFEGFAGHWECSNEPCDDPETMGVDLTAMADDIVEAVATPFTTVTVTDINCPNGAFGTFEFPTDNNNLGLEKGLVLTSGDASLTVGPNNATGAGVSNLAPGDPDLDFLSIQFGDGELSNDACIVELDVFVATDELTFEYVFGSEEYPEYVNSSFNDIFAFLVSGPGIVGDPGLNGQENIAVLPSTTTPVQINSVNNLTNWEYYRNSENSQEVQYDGLTADFMGVKKSLTARIDAIPCNTYHLKLAVADRGDFILDSGVFISEIKGGTPNLDIQFASGIDYFVEECTDLADELVISLSQPVDDTTYFTLTLGGTALQGTDYDLTLPNPIILFPGQQSIAFPITPIADTLTEGTETIIFELSNDFGCGPVIYETLTVNLEDNVSIDINAGADTLYVCEGNELQLLATGAVDYFWSPPGLVSNPFIADPTITPASDVWLEVTGTVGICSGMDSVYVSIIDPSIEVNSDDDVNICLGASVTLNANNNVGGQGLEWTPAIGLDDPTSENPVASPQETTTYTATISIAGCQVLDSITVNVDTMFFPQLNFADTVICQNYPVQLAEVLDGTTTYEWTPAAGLDDPTSSGPVAIPDQTTTYTLVATSANGNCTQEASTTVTVTPIDLDIEGDEYREICLGDSVALTTFSTPAGAEVQWSPAFYLSNPSGENTTATPDQTTLITAEYSINGCTVFDSVRIRVDSLPSQELFKIEDKPIYCPGDTVFLVSPTYEPSSFPDIEHMWIPFGTMLTPDSNWNLVIIATETHVYEREITNRGCSDISSIEVPVAIPPEIIVTAEPDSICPGESVQLNATVDPNQALEWMDDPSLSCTDCPNPIATPSGTTNYSVSAPDAECPAGGGITVFVIDVPALNLVDDQTICEGETIVLNGTNEPGVNYSWTSVPAGFTSNEPMPAVTPTEQITYSVIADNGACTSEAMVTLGVASGTLSVEGDQTICEGESAALSATTTGSPGTITWNPGGIVGENVNVMPDENTLYIATFAFGEDCILTDSVLVGVLDAPNINLADNDILCLGASITLNDILEAGVNYNWTSDPPVFTSTEATPTITPDETATYTLVADNGVCSTEGSVTIEVAFATIDAGENQVLCQGDTLFLSATILGTQGGVLTWSPGNLTGANQTILNADTSATYTAVYDYGNGCLASDIVEIEVIPGLEIGEIMFVPDSVETVCEGDTITLSVSVNPPGLTISWFENGELLEGLSDTTVSFIPGIAADDPASYTAIATNNSGCVAESDPKNVVIERCYVLPNAFTPDGDGVNDTFGLGLKGGNVEIVMFEIYNRWGNLVFESDGATTRWDGKVNGEDAASDVFVYIMKVRFPDGREEDFKGDVTLIR